METALIQAISTVGFPIIAFLLMYYLTTTTIKENTSAINRLETTIAAWKEKN